MQINRLFEIIYILLEKKKVTATELAAHFGVSRQTICRDIDTLSTAGIPIYTERGKGGGIRLLPEFVLNKSILSEEEQSEILSALHGLSKIQTGESNQILGKLSAIFNKTTTNWLEVDCSDWSQKNDYFDNLKQAILERRLVQFEYYNSYGDKSFRRVEPIQLWFKSKSWYLKGFCLNKEGMRVYKLLRIRNLVLTDEHFTTRDSLALSENPLENWDKQAEITLKLRIAPEMTYRVYDDFHGNEVEKQPDGSFIASVRFAEDNWVYSFLLSYGKYIEVLEPKHVRDVLKSDVEEILKKYL